MAKVGITLCALCFVCWAYLDAAILIRSRYIEELERALIKFKLEVGFARNEAWVAINEEKRLLENLHASAASIQKKVSDIMNSTLTELAKNVNSLLNDLSTDVTECMSMSLNIESRAMDILINSNTCIHDKLDEAELYLLNSTSSIQSTVKGVGFFSFPGIIERFSRVIKDVSLTPSQTKMLLELLSSAPKYAVEQILSSLTDATATISRIYERIISECVFAEEITLLRYDSKLAYRKIKTCVNELNFFDSEQQVNDIIR